MIKKETFYLVLFFVTIFYTQMIFSQTSQDSIKNSLNKGSWSLQFQISQNFTLSSFQGSNFSAKKHFSPRSAIRFGIGLSGYSRDQELTINRDNDNSLHHEDQLDDKLIEVDLNCYYLYYPHPQRRINMYFGGGPLIGFMNFNDKLNTQEVYQDTLNRDVSTDEDFQSISVGVVGLIGVEWFLNQQISIHAEYGSSISYVKEEREETRITNAFENDKETRVTKSEGYRINWRSNSVKFGVSVYF
jgi:hypothetical protein